VVTGTDGNYAVQRLAPGTYRVRVELSGFHTVTRNGIRLATGETLRLDLQLDVGGVTEAITVTGDAPVLRSEASGLGQVIDNRKVVELPFNGRNFITLASLAPGVALPPGIVATSYQRPAAAHERVSVRRDLGANTPPLGAPNTTVGAAAFGTITTAGDPRVIQLAVKFIF
jgi:hypothetical protein